jgi:hypothetical protein
MHRWGWPIFGSVGVAAVTVLMLWQPLAAVVALAICAVGVASLLIPTRHVFAVSSVGALAAAVFIPSSAVAGFPLGSFYPLFVASYFILLGLLRGGRRLRKPKLIVPLGVYYVILVAATLLAGNLDPFYLLITAAGPAIYWLVSSASRAEQTSIRRGVIAIAVIEAVLAVIESVTGTGPLLGAAISVTVENPFLGGIQRAQGTLGHPLVLSFLLLAALGMLLMRNAERTRLRWPSVLILFAGVVATGSTSSVIAALLLLGIWFLYRAGVASRVFAFLVAAVVALVVLGDGIIERTFGDELGEREIGHRLNSILAIPNLIFRRGTLDSIFGSGIGSAKELFISGVFKNDGFYTIDNQFVTALSAAGLIGFVFLVAFFVLLFFRASATYKPLIVAFIFMTVSFDFLFWSAATTVFFIVCALALSPEPAAPPKQEPGLGISSGRRHSNNSPAKGTAVGTH